MTTPSHHPNESLAWTLAQILRRAGADRAIPEIALALGLAGPWVAKPGVCPRTWSSFARDLCLVGVSEPFGVRLRDLHPSDAAIGLEESAEFPQHFEDSYVPLIRRALASGQTAIAWRGWQQQAALAWGLITTCDDHTLRGICDDGAHPEQNLISLESAAHQVYIVEDVQPMSAIALSREALIARAAASWLAFHDSACRNRCGAALGREAQKLFTETLCSSQKCFCGGDEHECVISAMTALHTSRRTCWDWWLASSSISSGHGTHLAAAARSAADIIADACTLWSASPKSPTVAARIADRLETAYATEIAAAAHALHLVSLHASVD